LALSMLKLVRISMICLKFSSDFCSSTDFPRTYIKLWNERWLKNELYLPKANEFICKNFGIFGNSIAETSKYPRKIIETESCECFYKLDKKFKLPHGYVNVFLTSPITETSVTNLNLTSIYSMCVKNFLSEKLYPATVSGYSYKLHSVDNGLVLRLSGFNEKLSLLVDIITKTVMNLESLMDKSVFETFRRELKKNFHSCLNDAGLLNE
jgi:nardilysin